MKENSQSFLLHLICTVDDPRLGNDTSSARKLKLGAICLPPTLFLTEHTASNQYGSILNGSFGLIPPLKVTPASSSAMQFDLT